MIFQSRICACGSRFAGYGKGMVIEMNIVFFSTNDVFVGEDRLKDKLINYKIVPTPVTDKAYCGVCIETDNEDAIEALEDMEFNVIRKGA